MITQNGSGVNSTVLETHAGATASRSISIERRLPSSETCSTFFSLRVPSAAAISSVCIRAPDSLLPFFIQARHATAPISARVSDVAPIQSGSVISSSDAICSSMSLVFSGLLQNQRLMPTARKCLSCIRGFSARRRHSRGVRLHFFAAILAKACACSSSASILRCCIQARYAASASRCSRSSLAASLRLSSACAAAMAI